jgi:hypothetical protein
VFGRDPSAASRPAGFRVPFGPSFRVCCHSQRPAATNATPAAPRFTHRSRPLRRSSSIAGAGGLGGREVRRRSSAGTHRVKNANRSDAQIGHSGSTCTSSQSKHNRATRNCMRPSVRRFRWFVLAAIVAHDDSHKERKMELRTSLGYDEPPHHRGVHRADAADRFAASSPRFLLGSAYTRVVKCPRDLHQVATLTPSDVSDRAAFSSAFPGVD